MWLLWVLPKNRPQPGSMFVSRENQIWPHFPGNHLLKPPSHTVSDFFFFFKLSLCFSFLFFTLSFFSFTGGLTWLMQTVKLNLPVSDLETTSKGKRGLGVISCQIDAKLKVGCSTSIHVLSVLTHSVTLDWNLWDVFSLCSSNLVSLIRHWFPISAIQQLGRRSGRLIVSGTTHTSTVFVKTFGFYTFFCWSSSLYDPFLFPYRLSSSHPFLFFASPPPLESKASKDQHKHTVRDRNNVSNEMRWQTDVCEQRWK